MHNFLDESGTFGEGTKVVFFLISQCSDQDASGEVFFYKAIRN